MSFPATFLSLIQSNAFKLGRWIEIEGLPFAIGDFSADSSFYTSRAANQRFKGIAHSLKQAPRNIDQSIDTLDGGAQTVGQIEFEIIDVAALNLTAIQGIDGSPMQWTGSGRFTDSIKLGADLTAAATTIPFVGSAAGFSNGGYLFIGTEAILIGTVGGSSFTGCTRAQFRSTAQAFGAGLPITTRPTVMANRRCWYYNAAVTTSQALSSTGATAANQCLRFSGICRNLKYKDQSLDTFVLPAQTTDQEFNRDCFRVFREFKMLGMAIADKDGKNGSAGVIGWPGITSNHNLIWNVPTGLFGNSENVIVRIDDEYFQVQQTGSGNSNALFLSARGLFGSLPVRHAEGASVREVIPIVEYRTTSQYYLTSKFKSAPTAGAPLTADHPLMLILQLLLSTGAGTNTAGGATRNYDVLPVDWGMGIDYTRIDIAGIEAVAMEEPQLRWGGLVEDPQNFISLMRSILGFAGYYYYTGIQDLLRIRRLRPPLPDVAQRAILNSSRINKNPTGWDGNFSGAVRDIEFSFGWDVIEQKFKRIVRFVTGADYYAKGLARQIKYETKYLYPGGSSIKGEPPFAPFDVDQWLLTRRDFYRTRYGKPPPIIHERCDFGFMDVEIGDLVLVTHANLPSTTSGARGMNQEIGEIIGKSIDDVTKTISFTILMTGYQLGSYRFIAPSLEIQTVLSETASGGSYLMKANSFTESAGAHGTAQTDGWIENSAVALTTMFDDESDTPIRFWTVDFGTSYGVPTDWNSYTYDPTTRILNVDWTGHVPGTFPIAGGFVTWDTYDGNGAQLAGDVLGKTALYAWAAKSNDKLGTNNDPGHLYFPI